MSDPQHVQAGGVDPRTSDPQRSGPRPADRRRAEAALREASRRLQTLRVFALTGGPYDPDRFDEAVLEFRRRWEEARRAGEQEGDAHRAA